MLWLSGLASRVLSPLVPCAYSNSCYQFSESILSCTLWQGRLNKSVKSPNVMRLCYGTGYKLSVVIITIILIIVIVHTGILIMNINVMQLQVVCSVVYSERINCINSILWAQWWEQIYFT